MKRMLFFCMMAFLSLAGPMKASAGNQVQYSPHKDHVSVNMMEIDPREKPETRSFPPFVGPKDSVRAMKAQQSKDYDRPFLNEMIGTSLFDLTRELPESSLGDFVCDAMRVLASADVAVLNPDSLHADLKAGPIKRGDINRIVPIDVTIFTVSMNGFELKRFIQLKVHQGALMQVSGIRYQAEPREDSLQFLTSMTLSSGAKLENNGRSYLVAMTSDEWREAEFMFLEHPYNDSNYLVRDAIESYIRDCSHGQEYFTYACDGRILIR